MRIYHLLLLPGKLICKVDQRDGLIVMGRLSHDLSFTTDYSELHRFSVLRHGKSVLICEICGEIGLMPTPHV